MLKRLSWKVLRRVDCLGSTRVLALMTQRVVLGKSRVIILFHAKPLRASYRLGKEPEYLY